MAGVTVDFNANVARFTSSVDKMTNDLNKFQSNASRVSKNLVSTFSGLGVGITVGGFAAFIKSSIDAADKLNDLNKSTGLSVEILSGLSLAAEKSGSDLEGVANAINKLSVNMGKDAEKFAKIGITAKDPLEAFKQLADVFNKIEDPQKRAAFAAEALGKSWQTTAPLLAEGSKAIGEMVKDGAEFSGITTKMAQDADKLNDSIAELMARFKGVGVRIASELFVAFGETDPITKLRGQIGDLERNMKTRGSVVGGWIFGTQEEKQARLDALKTELAELQRIASLPPTAKGKSPDVTGFIGDPGADARKKAEDDRYKDLQKFISERRKGEEESRNQDYQQIQRWKDLADPAAKYRDEIEAIKYSMEEVGGVSKEVGEANIKLLEAQIEKTNESTKEMSRAWETFADNTQRTLSDVLLKGLNGSFDDAGEMFKQMLLKMAADAAAAGIVEGLFGKKDESGKMVGGLLSNFISGQRAAGGPVTGGKTYLVGEKGPELFTPGSGGNITPNNKLGGGGGINYSPTINIDSRADIEEVRRVVKSEVRRGNADLVDSMQRKGMI